MRLPPWLGLFALSLTWSWLLYSRPTTSGYILDETYAIRDNFQLDLHFLGLEEFRNVFLFDYWGLNGEKSIGSYRPLPSFIFRVLSFTRESLEARAYCWLNIALHAANTLLLLRLWQKLAGGLPGGSRFVQRCFAAFLVLLHVSLAVASEAVAFAVGLPDLLQAGLLLLLVSHCSAFALRTSRSPFLQETMHALSTFGLLVLLFWTKETAFSALPLLVLLPWLVASPDRQRRVWRSASSALTFLLALGFTSSMRERLFVAPRMRLSQLLPSDLRPNAASVSLGDLLSWVEVPATPLNTIQNPVLESTLSIRLSTGADLFLRQIGQVIAPLSFSADYSVPREVAKGWTASGIVGLVILTLLAAVIVRCALRAFQEQSTSKLSCQQSDLPAVGALWLLCCYFPISNTLFALPVLRAERFMYSSVVGLELLFLWGVVAAAHRLSLNRYQRVFGAAALAAALLFQSTCARFSVARLENRDVFLKMEAASPQASCKQLLDYSARLEYLGRLKESSLFASKALAKNPEWQRAIDTVARLNSRIEEQ